MKQIAWYAFQITVFLGTAYVFLFVVRPPEEQGNHGMALLIICTGITAVATGLVFWTGRLISWVSSRVTGKINQTNNGRVDGGGVIARREPRELSARRRIGQ